MFHSTLSLSYTVSEITYCLWIENLRDHKWPWWVLHALCDRYNRFLPVLGSNIRIKYINLLPAGLRVAQPCRYCFTQWSKNGFFASQGRHVAPINVKFGTGERSRLSGQKCGNTAPKTVKITNFGQKIVPQGRLVCNIFTKFSAFVRVYR